jgi:hypothetical protein
MSLAKQFVEFAAKGMDVVQGAMASIKTGLDHVEAQTQKANAQLQATPVAIGAAVAGFQLLTNAARSWVSAGMAGTAHGNLLALQFTMLSREIAGVFVPTINLAIRGIEKITAWFRSLTGEQQGNIRRWVEAAAAMTIVYGIVGMVTKAFAGFIFSAIGGVVSLAATLVGTVIPAIATLVTAVVTGSGIAGAALNLAFAGIPLILGLVASVISAFVSLGIVGVTAGTGIAVGTKTGRDAIAKLWEIVGPLASKFKALYDSLATGLGPTLDRIGSSFVGLVGRVGTVFDGLVQRAGPGLRTLAEWLANIGSKLAAWLDSITTAKMERWIQTAIDKFNEWKPVMVELINLGKEIGTQIAAGMELAKSAMELFGGSAKSVVADLKTLKLLLSAFDIIGNLRKSYNDLFGSQRVIERSASRISPQATQTGTAPRTDVNAVGGNFEQAMDLFRRLNEVGIKSQIQDDIRTNTRRTAEAVERLLGRPNRNNTFVPPPASARLASRIMGGINGTDGTNDVTFNGGR